MGLPVTREVAVCHISRGIEKATNPTPMGLEMEAGPMMPEIGRCYVVLLLRDRGTVVAIHPAHLALLDEHAYVAVLTLFLHGPRLLQCLGQRLNKAQVA